MADEERKDVFNAEEFTRRSMEALSECDRKVWLLNKRLFIPSKPTWKSAAAIGSIVAANLILLIVAYAKWPLNRYGRIAQCFACMIGVFMLARAHIYVFFYNDAEKKYDETFRPPAAKK